MKTCLHCGETFKREFDGALGGLKVVTNQMVKSSYKVIGLEKSKICFAINRNGVIYNYVAESGICPKCGDTSIIFNVHKLRSDVITRDNLDDPIVSTYKINILPLFKERPVDKSVPPEIAEDYKEATRISDISIKGASTLARRCLQRTLRDKFPDVRKLPNFKKEIDWVIDNAGLDDVINKALHKVRDAGNFGAHAGADGLTEIYELSSEELGACFVLLHSLFEILYVESERRKQTLSKLSNIPQSKK